MIVNFIRFTLFLINRKSAHFHWCRIDRNSGKKLVDIFKKNTIYNADENVDEKNSKLSIFGKYFKLKVIKFNKMCLFIQCFKAWCRIEVFYFVYFLRSPMIYLDLLFIYLHKEYVVDQDYLAQGWFIGSKFNLIAWLRLVPKWYNVLDSIPPDLRGIPSCCKNTFFYT